jgi:dTDP-4-amino-4,6-dideoxygalactose transaminase
MRSPRVAVWPSLPLDVYLSKRSLDRPFPLDREECRTYARARHGLWNGCNAVGLAPGDVVLAPAYHHGSEIEALLRAGLEVRFFDVTDALEPDPIELDRLLGPMVRVLYLIHYLGFPQTPSRWRSWCDDRGLLLFEDAAQAWLASRDGVPVGTLGDLAIYCLYKTIGVPDGAALICHPRALDHTARRRLGLLALIKRHGAWLAQKEALTATILSKLDRATGAGRREVRSTHEEFELGDPHQPASSSSAWILPRAFDTSIADRRRSNYRFLLERLNHRVPAPFASLPDGACPFAFPVEANEPGRAVSDLEARGVMALQLWKHPHPALAVPDFPRAAHLRETVIALPVHQELSPANLRHIADAAREVL